MYKPFISVIIPVYNCEKYIAGSIYSILNQPCKDLEVVVVNDGSTDNTDKIVQKIADIDNRVKYYKKQNSGVSDTRNLAIEKSSGDYIAFLDADDIWCKNFYDQNLRNEIKEKEADIFSFNFIEADYKMNKGLITYIRGLDNNKFSYFENHFCSYIYKAKLIQKNHIIFTSQLSIDEDHLFCLDAFMHANDVIPIKKEIFIYRNNPNSLSHTSFDKIRHYLDVVNLWEQRIQRSNNSDYKIVCLRNILMSAMRYIEVSSKFGQSYEKSLEILEDKVSFDLNLLDNKEIFVNQPYFLNLQNNIKYIVKNNNKKISFFRIENFFKQFKFIRYLYYVILQKKSYKLDIRKYV
jgi:glycosyltransferase involved in cell wall biosynthesis